MSQISSVFERTEFISAGDARLHLQPPPYHTPSLWMDVPVRSTEKESEFTLLGFLLWPRDVIKASLGSDVVVWILSYSKTEFVVLITTDLLQILKMLCSALWRMFFEDAFWILRFGAEMGRGETNKPFCPCPEVHGQEFSPLLRLWIREGGGWKTCSFTDLPGQCPSQVGARIALWVKLMVASAAVCDFLSCCSDTGWIIAVTRCYHSQIISWRAEALKYKSSKWVWMNVAFDFL